MKNENDNVLIELWDRLMRLQTDFSQPVELSFYYNSQEWLNAKSVIDLGTGNGYYLLKLVQLFPDKRYTGIDSNFAFSKLAKELFHKNRLTGTTRVEIRQADLFSVEGSYDFVLSRLLVQHLNSLENFLVHVNDILCPGGKLLVIDSEDSLRKFVPELRYMRAFFEEFRKQRKKAGCSRDAGISIIDIADDFGFEVSCEKSIIVPSTIGYNKEFLYHSYQTVFEIVKQEFRVDFDYIALRRELDNWKDNPVSYAQVGVHMALYRKK